mmetsp:Transcript_18461/g.50691  ORF Transcript_18461/g.50691 Transcript_18461/m.50691 type:complete len:395 (-) Transcript_18461:141-1325(-)
MPVATTFDAKDEKGRSLLGEVAVLDTCVTVIDSLNFLKDYQSHEKARDRSELGAEAEDERTIVDLLAEQAEFANVLVLNKTDLVSPEELAVLKGILKKLNPGANVIESQWGVVTPTSLLNTETFDLNSASMLPGWKAELSGVQHKPETEEYGIFSFVYRTDRPFHPDRLEELLRRGALPGVLRVKGYAWVASDHLVSVEWSQAGFATHLKAGYTWLPLGWARGRWPEAAQAKWKDSPYGDRRQELVFIGNAMDEAATREALNGALVTDEEFALGPDVWTKWTKVITKEILAPEDAELETEFIMDLLKGPGDLVGMEVDETEGVRITYVNPGGLTHKWNSEKINSQPELVVRVGYSIKDVNGVGGVAGMQLIKDSTNLRFTISRKIAVAEVRRFP